MPLVICCAVVFFTVLGVLMIDLNSFGISRLFEEFNMKSVVLEDGSIYTVFWVQSDVESMLCICFFVYCSV